MRTLNSEVHPMNHSFTFLTRTDMTIPVVLTTEACVRDANDTEEGRAALLDYAVGGSGGAGLVVPPEATRFHIRALSYKEVTAIREEVEAQFPDIEAFLAKLYLAKERGDEDTMTPENLVQLSRARLKRAALDLAYVDKGLVRIDGVNMDNPGAMFAPESDMGIYPLEDRAEATIELATHIRRVTELGPLAVAQFKPLFG
jgi:hypothetical protein